MAARSVWREVTETVLGASAEAVRSIVCPKCGAGLSVRFDPNSPQPDGTTAGFLMINCVECGAGSALDNLDESPPWIESLGLRINTSPGSADGG